jgi:N6-adenosine-specific RNA methylase IME4
MTDLTFHPLSEIFPLIDGAEFAALVADIKAHGLHEPVVVYENKILDGRNRFRACQAAGMECSFTPYQGNDPVAYPSMTIEEICGLQVSELAMEDAVLFLWTTLPHLELALRVIASWDFTYKTQIVWVKPSVGLGYFVRNQHEVLLIATRGDIPTPAPAHRPASELLAPRREHSEKPDETYALIERMYPDLPKIELFARSARAGWAAWGNQAPAEASGASS